MRVLRLPLACLVLGALALSRSIPAVAASAAFPTPFLAVPAATTVDSVTTIILVRHAEKDTVLLGSDPPLSAAGILRSHELARVLGGARISAIYVTPWQRTRQTAQPLATRLGDSLTVEDSVAETVRALRERHAGQRVLVVGHSNTLPQIIEQLAGEKIAPFTEGDYDRLYVVTLIPGRPARVLALRYGAGKTP
jgi:broad specificity phosphatase PhoE